MLKQGFIEKRFERPSQYTWPNGKPKPSMWSITVDNVSYGCKTTEPPKEGTYVQFEASQEGKYWNADGSTLKAVDAPVMIRPDTNTIAYSVHNNQSSEKKTPYVDTRQDSIVYQNARGHALEFVTMLLSQGLIDFGKAKGAQKIELLEVYLDHYTPRFYEDTKRLSPPEHDSPVEASPLAEATALMKPVRKARVVAATEAEPFNDDLPFGN